MSFSPEQRLSASPERCSLNFFGEECYKRCGPVAQRLEQRTHNLSVGTRIAWFSITYVGVAWVEQAERSHDCVGYGVCYGVCSGV